MKIPSFPFLALTGLALLGTGCANVLYYGNEASVQIAAEYKPTDPSEPAHLQVGIRDRTAIAVPPRYSLATRELSREDKIAQGEILSTASAFSVHRVNADGTANPATGTGVRVRSMLFTGIASENLVGTMTGAPTTATQAAAEAQKQAEVKAATTGGTTTTVLANPKFAPATEALGDAAKEAGKPTPKP